MTLLDWLIIIAGWVELLFDARLFLWGKNDAICYSLQMFWARILEGQSRPKGFDSRGSYIGDLGDEPTRFEATICDSQCPNSKPLSTGSFIFSWHLKDGMVIPIHQFRSIQCQYLKNDIYIYIYTYSHTRVLNFAHLMRKKRFFPLVVFSPSLAR